MKTNGNMIKSTTNYKMFKVKKGNRAVVRASVNRLANSIKQKNMLPVNPIIVNKKLEIIDGQHRLAAAQLIGTPIFYVIFDPASLTEIQLLNANMKAWGSKEFLSSYVAIGKKDYIDFKDFYEKYKFTFNATIVLLASQELIKFKDITQKFREGNFEVYDLQKSIELAETVMELNKYVDPAVTTNARYYEAVFVLLRKYPEQMKDLTEKVAGGAKVHRQVSRNDYLQHFEVIINKGHYGRPIRLF